MNRPWRKILNPDFALYAKVRTIPSVVKSIRPAGNIEIQLSVSVYAIIACVRDILHHSVISRRFVTYNATILANIVSWFVL